MPDNDGRRISRTRLEETRRLAIRMIGNGMRVDEVARVLECGRSTVFGWVAAYRESGSEGLSVKTASGRPPKLSAKQEARLYALLKKNPQQLEFDFGLWTRQLVGELIRREFGVSLSPPSVGRLLRRMGMSPQRPVVRAYEQDPDRVRRWKLEEYPAIRAQAAAQKATIFFEDESGIRSDYHSGTTWAPVGQTPKVAGTGNRVSVNMISAISAKGALHFSLFDGSMNAIKFIEFCTKLLSDVEGKIFLIVDGSSTHTAKAVTEYVKATEGRLQLFFLPPYSPELNPDEWVWKNVKHDNVGRVQVFSKGQLMKAVENALTSLQQRTATICGFFRDPDLSYIGA